MDLQTLKDTLQEMFNRPTAIYTEPGVSYGPAMSRWTKTPLKFQSSHISPGINGYYDWEADKPSITINPKSDEHRTKQSTIGDTIRHESIHALLSDALTKKAGSTDIVNSYRILNQENPSYYGIAKNIAGKRGGMLPVEVPAYAGQREFRQFGIDPKTRAEYINNLMQSLQTIDPATGETYRRIAGIK